MKKFIFVLFLAIYFLVPNCYAAKFKITPRESYVDEFNKYSYEKNRDVAATVDGTKCDTIVLIFGNFVLKDAKLFVEKMKKKFKSKGFIVASVSGKNDKTYYIQL